MQDLFEKPIPAYKIIKDHLLYYGRARNTEIAELMKGRPGQLSWGQRLREIRQELQSEGKDLLCTLIRPGIYEYKIVTGKAKQ